MWAFALHLTPLDGDALPASLEREREDRSFFSIVWVEREIGGPSSLSRPSPSLSLAARLTRPPIPLLPAASAPPRREGPARGPRQSLFQWGSARGYPGGTWNSHACHELQPGSAGPSFQVPPGTPTQSRSLDRHFWGKVGTQSLPSPGAIAPVGVGGAGEPRRARRSSLYSGPTVSSDGTVENQSRVTVIITT